MTKLQTLHDGAQTESFMATVKTLERKWNRKLLTIWCEMHCQLDALPLEITPILKWHSACEFVQPLEEAIPLPVTQVVDYCPCTAHQMTCRLLHYFHDLVEAGWLFLFIGFSLFLGFSHLGGTIQNRYFGRRLFPWARAAFVPTIILLRFLVLIRFLLCWGYWSSTYRTTTLNGFMTLFVKGFQIWEAFQLP